MAIEKQICSYCGQEKNLIQSFYVSNSVVYKFNGRLTVCKSCLIEIYNDLCRKYENDKLALYNLCRMVDTYYTDDAYDMVKRLEGTKDYNMVKIYFQKINSLLQFKGNTFANTTVDKSDIEHREKLYDEMKEVDLGVSKEIRNFWGSEFSSSECISLQEYYDDLEAFYENKTPIQRTIYKDLAINELRKTRSSNPTDAKKYIDIQSALMNDANIKPIQDKGDDSLSTWGLWIKKIEDEEPIPEASDEFKDVDGIWNYIEKFFVKHMKRIFGVEEDDLDQEELEIKNNTFILKSGDD